MPQPPSIVTRRAAAARPWRERLPRTRRIVQCVALAAFLYLFLVTAWPFGGAWPFGLVGAGSTAGSAGLAGAASAPARFAAPGVWPVEAFLWLDPLVGLVSSLAARAWSIALWGGAFWALVTLVLPRGFCSYFCPLGTLIAASDWLVARLVHRPRGKRPGPVATRWRSLRFLVLAAVAGAALAGVQSAGYLAAIPLLTRGLGATVGHWQFAWSQGWQAAGALGVPAILAGVLLAAPLLLAFAGRRFWCRTVCPTGALVSVLATLRLVERQVHEATCVRCGRCHAECDFGAVASDDFATLPSACSSCQDCAAVCPVDAVSFPRRSAGPNGTNETSRAAEAPPAGTSGAAVRPARGTLLGNEDLGASANPVRRDAESVSTGGRSAVANEVANRARAGGPRHLSVSMPSASRPLGAWGPQMTRRQALLGAGAAAVGAVLARAAAATGADPPSLLRPPGSVPGERFLDLCIRCGECIRVCPGPVLRLQGLEAGLEGIWTPVADPVRAGCLPDCNRCTQACPTGAIRALTLEEKRRFRMGLARVDRRTCLAHTGRSECSLCFEACYDAGYKAIAMRSIQLPGADQVPEGVFSDAEIETMGKVLAPVVEAEKCVGCGLCERRCHEANVVRLGKLHRSAVHVSPLE
jgi:ferredoxin